MQRTSWWAAVVAIGAFLVAPLAAQVRVEVTREGSPGTKVDVAQSFRSSHLIGMRVKNKEGKDIGRIDDLVIGLGKGDIRYAAVSFGGFAGIGTKLFAVPWQAMTFHFGEKDRFFVFDVTEEQLKSAPGFDSSNWPNVGDTKWSTSIDKHYKIARETAKDGNIAVDDAYRVSTLKGMKVRNDQGKDLGHVDELVFDVKGGKVNYAALSFGSFAGLGGKLFAIPFHAFRFHHAANDRFLVLNRTEEQLKAAPGFDSSHWPNTADPTWSRDVDRYYEDLRTANRRDERKD